LQSTAPLVDSGASLDCVANRVSIDLRAERDAFITDENATFRRAPRARAAPFNEAPHVVRRLTAERTRQLLRRGGSGHLAGSIVRVLIKIMRIGFT
jgi:hypothetical protein